MHHQNGKSMHPTKLLTCPLPFVSILPRTGTEGPEWFYHCLSHHTTLPQGGQQWLPSLPAPRRGLGETTLPSMERGRDRGREGWRKRGMEGGREGICATRTYILVSMETTHHKQILTTIGQRNWKLCGKVC